MIVGIAYVIVFYLLRWIQVSPLLYGQLEMMNERGGCFSDRKHCILALDFFIPFCLLQIVAVCILY